MLVSLPQSRLADPVTGMLGREWLQYFLNPVAQRMTLQYALAPTSGGTGSLAVPAAGNLLIGDGVQYVLSTMLPVTSGGTGVITPPGINQILLGNGLTYALVSQIPVSLLPAFSGDVTTVAGNAVTTLATVNSAPASYGSGSVVPTFTVNGKGLVIAAAGAAITGAQTMLVAAGFGCNGKAIQSAATSGPAVAATGSTGTVPFGYSTAAQADRIVVLLNAIQAALIANGILV